MIILLLSSVGLTFGKVASFCLKFSYIPSFLVSFWGNSLRAAELKHGRVCMLAALGLVTPELVQNPGAFSGFKFAPEFSELNAIKALSAVPKLGLAQIVLVIAFAEIATFKKNYNEKYNYEDNLTNLERQFYIQGRTQDLSFAAKSQARSGVNAFGNKVDVGFIEPEKAIPGDLGFDPLGLANNGVNPDYALAEIKHARLAVSRPEALTFHVLV